MVKRCVALSAVWVLLLGLVLPLRAPVAADPPAAAGVLLPPVMREWAPTIERCYAGCGGAEAAAVDEAYEQQVVELVNIERDARGLPPLKRTAGLTSAARYHATDMGQDDYFEHDTYDRNGELLIRVCDTWSRIGSYTTGACGENVAAGFADPEQVMAAWMGSGGHQDNILSTSSWELGVGYYQESSYLGRYWTQDFGRQPGVYPLVINLEAARCDSELVSLYVYGAWDEIRLRNDGGAWSGWLPFQNRLDWTLQGVVGERTVEAELRSASGSTITSDTIYLTRVTAPRLGNLPQDLTFWYSIAEGRMTPAAIVLEPANTANDAALSWQVEQTGTWYNASPAAGTTPDTLTITPSCPDTSSPAVYSGALVVTVTSPGGVQDSPQTIDLRLQVIEQPLQRAYLPLVVGAD